ncbi:MAG TPA: DUF2946 family protein [Ramlibacter sp.]|uniref:DUF2946 family protein n=1 Tax=Ramlibacter sp. TaxID=1917967 RepID=UPI002ED029A7
MNLLRPSHRTARLLTAWLVVWFLAMAWRPAIGIADAGMFAPAGIAAMQAEYCGGDESAGPHAHQGHDGAQAHCPLCAHAASSLSLDAAPGWRAHASIASAPPAIPYVPVRATVPPPARAPPAFS